MKDIDPYNLSRFLEAQDSVYERVCGELRAGRKVSHWMWFIFPQFRGLGRTETSIFFAIASAEEAKAYLKHPLLGARLNDCCLLLLEVEGKSAEQIFGSPDHLKLKSSMTLFAHVAKQNELFSGVLKRFFDGKTDTRTCELLA